MTDRKTRTAVAVCAASFAVGASLALASARSKASPIGAPTSSGQPVPGSAASTAHAGGEVVVPPGVRATLVGESSGAKTYQLVFAPGTEAMGAIAEFVTANHFQAAHFQGIGACTDAVVAYWDPGLRDYRKRQYRQQMEIVSMLGDAAPTPGDGAGLHVHMALAFADGTMHGGHLFETHVSPTLELVLTVSPNAVQRRYDESFRGWLLAP